MKYYTIPVVAALALWAVTSGAGPETVTCALDMPSDGGYITTATVCTGADGGVVSCGTGFCNWPAGSNINLQCTADVYMDQDGNDPTSADILVDFTNLKDPYMITLVNKQQTIAVELVTPAASQSCKFAPTMKRKPW